MAAALLSPSASRARRVPRLNDVATMAKLLELLGARVEYHDHEVLIDASSVNAMTAPYDLVRTMRASFYVLGPLLARFGRARVSLPGGCAWGPRPVDLHLEAMKALGARIAIEHGDVVASADRLRGAEINFRISSVGATGNAMMAACLAEGTTVITNAACEPEMPALARYLNGMGAKIRGAGTSRVVIDGVTSLGPGDDEIIPDRVEAGTFLVAGAITGGTLQAIGADASHIEALLDCLRRMGARVEVTPAGVSVSMSGRPRAADVTTGVYPGFPTDLQAQMMAFLAVSEGTGTVTETIYYDRFTHVPELQRLGADIRLDGNVAVIRGVPRLLGARVMSTDIRASAALILAGLVAEGTTEISRIYHIDRGYEAIEEKLRAAGAEIRRDRDSS
jgi:UDP-N-acetylglucosamine 1-carboxyvinyltransferase